MQVASRCGHVDVIAFLRGLHVEFDSSCVFLAMKYGHLNCAKNMINDGCEYTVQGTQSILRGALMSGNLASIDWVLDTVESLNLKASGMKIAANYGSTQELLVHLFERYPDCKSMSRDVVQHALIGRRNGVFHYLLSDDSFVCQKRSIEYIFQNDLLDFYRILEKHGHNPILDEDIVEYIILSSRRFRGRGHGGSSTSKNSVIRYVLSNTRLTFSSVAILERILRSGDQMLLSVLIETPRDEFRSLISLPSFQKIYRLLFDATDPTDTNAKKLCLYLKLGGSFERSIPFFRSVFSSVRTLEYLFEHGEETFFMDTRLAFAVKAVGLSTFLRNTRGLNLPMKKGDFVLNSLIERWIAESSQKRKKIEDRSMARHSRSYRRPKPPTKTSTKPQRNPSHLTELVSRGTKWSIKNFSVLIVADLGLASSLLEKMSEKGLMVEVEQLKRCPDWICHIVNSVARLGEHDGGEHDGSVDALEWCGENGFAPPPPLERRGEIVKGAIRTGSVPLLSSIDSFVFVISPFCDDRECLVAALDSVNEEMIECILSRLFGNGESGIVDRNDVSLIKMARSIPSIVRLWKYGFQWSSEIVSHYLRDFVFPKN